MNCTDYEACIEACLHCASVCHRCANIALKENHVGECTRLNMECAATCTAAATLMSFESKYSEKIGLICIEICEKCAEICSKQDNVHHSECVKACLKCAKECKKCLLN